MRCVGALLDNAQKLHAVRRRDISIVRHNERPSDVIQYFTPLRHNRPASFFSPSPRAPGIMHYPLAPASARINISFDATFVKTRAPKFRRFARKSIL